MAGGLAIMGLAQQLSATAKEYGLQSAAVFEGAKAMAAQDRQQAEQLNRPF